MHLRPYQTAAIETARAWLTEAGRSLVLVAPTGSGKGTIAAHVMLSAAALGGRSLFVVHRQEIARDVAQRLIRAGIVASDLCVCAEGGCVGSPSAAVQVCTVQTLFASGQRPPASLVVWDECHHAVASTYRTVREAYPDAVHLGLTATPERADRSALGDVFQKLHVVASVRELVDAGHLVPCDVVAARPGAALAEQPLVAWRREAPGRQTVVFAANVRHGIEVTKSFTDAGVAAAFIDGKTPSHVRRDTLARLADGRLTVVVNVYVLTEGFDCPSLKVCLLTRGCGAASTYLQMVGRVLRPGELGERALLIDLRGVVHEHGLPDDERSYSLAGRAIVEGSKLSAIRQCLSCGCVFRSGPTACIRCGAAMPAPELPVVQQRALERAPVLVPRAEREAYLRRLRAIATREGYRGGWVGLRFKERFGFWPRGLPPAREETSGVA